MLNSTASNGGDIMVIFRVEFWDYYREKWKRYEVECPDNLRTVEEYAECITGKLAENYANRLYRACVVSGGDPEVCASMIRGWRNTYYDKMYPIIEEFLISASVRKEVKKITKRIAEVSEDVLALLKSREIALIKYGECRKRGRRCRLGLSSTNLVMFDVDCRRFECLKELIMLSLVLCRLYGISSIIYATQRGFHLVGLDPVPRNRWREIYGLVEDLIEEGKLKHIDRLHVTMSIARGFSTVSVTPTRDIHYLITASRLPTGEVESCGFWYSHVAMHRDRAVTFAMEEFDKVEPITRNPLWRSIREKWIKFLEVSGG